MMKYLMAVLMAVLTLPAAATTKPTDVVQVHLMMIDESVQKYAKPWKDLTIDATTRQKILTKEAALAKEFRESYRVYAIRIDRHTDNSTTTGAVLYLAPYGMVVYKLDSGEYCSISFEGNGSMVSGTNCKFL